MRESDDVDNMTQKTALEALSSKISCCQLGYLSDNFVQCFWKKPLIRKSPIINRGYFGRVECMSETVASFLSLTKECNEVRQIISLGIGFDTLSLRLLETEIPNVCCYEVDFEDIIVRKVGVMLSESSIRGTLHIVDESLQIDEYNKDTAKKFSISQYEIRAGCFRLSNNLCLLSADLRCVDRVLDALQQANINMTSPTLIITECVLVYLQRHDTENLCSSLSSFFTQAVWVSYDMINPDDVFGRVMRTNLSAAGHRVPGFIEYGTLLSQEQRFLGAGWVAVHSIDMLAAYNTVVSEEQRRRVLKLEIFDELEEWKLLMTHYCLTVAVKAAPENSLHGVFERIRMV